MRSVKRTQLKILEAAESWYMVHKATFGVRKKHLAEKKLYNIVDSYRKLGYKYRGYLK
jgi:hypothetical protein